MDSTYAMNTDFYAVRNGYALRCHQAGIDYVLAKACRRIAALVHVANSYGGDIAKQKSMSYQKMCRKRKKKLECVGKQMLRKCETMQADLKKRAPNEFTAKTKRKC